MKSLVKIFLFLFCASLSAQKIKIKKGEVYFDKVAIPIRIDSEYEKIKGGVVGDFSQMLTFYNTISSEVFIIANYKGKMMPTGGKEVWLEISDPKKEKTNSVDFDINLGYGKKGVLRHFLKKYQFINVSGNVNQLKIDDFFNTTTKSVAKTKAQGAIAIEDKVAESRKIPLTIDLNTKFISNQSGKIGFFKVNPDNSIVIGDLDNKKIATASIDSFGKTVNVQSQLLKENFSYRNLSTSLVNIEGKGTITFVKELVYQLHSRGLTLGNQVSKNQNTAYQKKREEQAVNFEEAKVNSTNIYDKKGYAIDEKGEQFEGAITIAFEQIVNANDRISSGTSNIGGGGIGNTLSITYINKKGKSKRKSISAKKNTSFCIVNDNGEEECYKALKVMGGPIMNESDGPLALASSKGKFLKEVYKEGDLVVYQYPPTKTYYLKIIDKEKAFNFSISLFGKVEKKANNLKEYLNGCDYTDKNKYVEKAFKELATIKELINYYNTSCK